MDYLTTRDDESYFVAHHGIKGQKWGVRRFENLDGTLTPEGRLRYRESEKDAAKYKSPGKRIGNTLKKGLIGGLVGAGALLGISAAVLTGGGSIGLAGGMTLAGSEAVTSMLGLSAIGGTATGLATTTVSGLKNGLQAVKVRRGLNFINQYEQAYKNTQKQELRG